MVTASPCRRASASVALCLLYLLQSIPLAAGHLRHRPHHLHNHDDRHSDPADHNHHHHRRTNNLIESDFAPHGAAGHHADIFDSCFVACYKDIVDRYGAGFADQMRVDGFTFEDCPNDDDDNDAATTTNDKYNNNDHNNTTTETEQQRALHRILGATNQLHRIWNMQKFRGSDGKLHIPYAIKDTNYFTPETYSTIQLAMSHIEQSTGVIKFVPRATYESEYIYFNHETYYEGVCAANLGKQTNTRTNVYLGWCRFERHLGNIVHELLHALGFWHEHSRPDRDEHISIIWPNLRESARNNFEKATMVNSLGSPYDFTSIMHYPPLAFSTNNKATIVPVDPLESWETLGQRAKLSEHDVHQLRLLHQCASGPRVGGDIPVDELCSQDCPCWEHAMGECTSDDECMGDLVCEETPSPLPTVEYVNLLPLYAATTGSFSCNDYCHASCCYYANSIMKCPETCDSAPPQVGEPGEIPERMCVTSDNGGGGGGSGSGGTSATAATATAMTTSATTAMTSTTTSTTAATTTMATTTAITTSTTPNSPPWYVDWGPDKCVQYCVGPAPCGGFGKNVTLLYETVEACCSTHLSYMPFRDCHAIPETLSPTSSKSPSRAPSQSPSPTPMPTASPAVMTQPSQIPTTHPTAVPSQSPTAEPSQDPLITTTAATTTTATTTSTSTSTSTTTEEFSATGDWYIDWDINKCVRDCMGERPCRYRRKESWEPGHSTVQRCCNSMPSVSFEDCSYEPTIEKRTGTGPPTDTRWYPAATECLNDGNSPPWQRNHYSSKATCCTSHFKWDYNNCMGITPAASGKWYINWARGKCVQDCEEGGSCDGLVPGSWITTHNSAEMCCNAHMSYVRFAECKYDG